MIHPDNWDVRKEPHTESEPGLLGVSQGSQIPLFLFGELPRAALRLETQPILALDTLHPAFQVLCPVQVGRLGDQIVLLVGVPFQGKQLILIPAGREYGLEALANDGILDSVLDKGRFHLRQVHQRRHRSSS